MISLIEYWTQKSHLLEDYWAPISNDFLAAQFHGHIIVVLFLLLKVLIGESELRRWSLKFFKMKRKRLKFKKKRNLFVLIKRHLNMTR